VAWCKIGLQFGVARWGWRARIFLGAGRGITGFFGVFKGPGGAGKGQGRLPWAWVRAWGGRWNAGWWNRWNVWNYGGLAWKAVAGVECVEFARSALRAGPHGGPARATHSSGSTPAPSTKRPPASQPACAPALGLRFGPPGVCGRSRISRSPPPLERVQITAPLPRHPQTPLTYPLSRFGNRWPSNWPIPTSYFRKL